MTKTPKKNGNGVVSLNLGRRSLLRGGLAASAMIAAPAIVRAQNRGRVFIRTSGGSYEEALKEGTWNAFTTKTGIEVVPVPANTGKLLAMVEAGGDDLDLVSANGIATRTLQTKGAFEELSKFKFELTDLKDIDSVTPFSVGYNAFAEALVYNTEVFAKDHPSNWKEFWDQSKFPGKRMLQDAKAIAPSLEFALLSDGVAMDKLYPLDVDRAFKQLKVIKPNIVKFYDTAALGAQLLAEKTVVAGSLWTNRILPLRDKGVPIAIEWNQAMRSTEYLSVLKNAKNRDNAFRLLDFSSTPEAQARSLPRIGLSPTNAKAFNFIDAKVAADLPTGPKNKPLGFVSNDEWWVNNRAKVSERWEEFLLG